MTTVSDAVSRGAATLAEAGVASPLIDAELLACHLLGIDRMQLFFRKIDTMPPEYEQLIERRRRREPLQHILGTAPVGSLELAVGPGVFIPRPETELLGHWAVTQLEQMRRQGVDKPAVVDLCTGSGTLALYIAHEVPEARVAAVELDPQAAAWARRNIASLAPHVELVIGDATDANLLASWHGRCDVVVSNPPYVPLSTPVEPEVRQDPAHAVFSGESGMDVIDSMVPVIQKLLRPGGWVGIEHDDSTSKLVQGALAENGAFGQITGHKDLAGRDRFVTAQKP